MQRDRSVIFDVSSVASLYGSKHLNLRNEVMYRISHRLQF